MKGKGKTKKGRRCPRCKGTGKRFVPGPRIRVTGMELPSGDLGRCDYCGGTGRVEK